MRNIILMTVILRSLLGINCVTVEHFIKKKNFRSGQHNVQIAKQKIATQF